MSIDFYKQCDIIHLQQVCEEKTRLRHEGLGVSSGFDKRKIRALEKEAFVTKTGLLRTRFIVMVVRDYALVIA